MSRPAAARDLVPDRILARAAARPGAIAVIAGDEEVDYRTLIGRATSLARELAAAGVGPDRVVGLAVPRSVDGLVGLLGILLAGGAYLYLDPDLPPDRARYMLDESDVRIVVDTATVAGARSVLGSTVDPKVRPRHLAYVVYTSGSTGVPRGVAVEHGGVANMTRWLADVFAVAPGTRALQFASWSWDASAGEILVALAAGATVVLAPDGVRHGGPGLAELIRAARVNLVTLTPSVLALLPAGELPGLRTVAAVGETCPPELVARWAGPGRRFLNGYGPTEATVAVSVGECQPGDEVHIGAPLPGARIRVVDERERPVLPGRPGHLLVGGAGLARGYVGPVADGRFVRDGRGTRWFRTGDRVRQRADGTMVHLGRFDDQVQVHGYRVELSEVEATLRRHPAVAACAATVQGGRLVAYVVRAGPAGSTAGSGVAGPAELVEVARGWLPSHMVPEVRLTAALPLTANGKVDRAALGATPDSLPAPDPAPDPILVDVLAIVRGVLETDQVGPDDDVFDLGGHSLLAAELSVAISARFGLELPAVTVVDHPTPGRLATVIRGGVA